MVGDTAGDHGGHGSDEPPQQNLRGIVGPHIDARDSDENGQDDPRSAPPFESPRKTDSNAHHVGRMGAGCPHLAASSNPSNDIRQVVEWPLKGNSSLEQVGDEVGQDPCGSYEDSPQPSLTKAKEPKEKQSQNDSDGGLPDAFA